LAMCTSLFSLLFLFLSSLHVMLHEWFGLVMNDSIGYDRKMALASEWVSAEWWVKTVHQILRQYYGYVKYRVPYVRNSTLQYVYM
jgi:hypothetical protein